MLTKTLPGLFDTQVAASVVGNLLSPSLSGRHVT